VQARDPGDESIAAVSDLGRFDGGVPAALLLIEPTEQQVHLPVNLLVGMKFQAEVVGALALMDVLLGHGTTLRNLLSKPRGVYKKPGSCSWMAPKIQEIYNDTVIGFNKFDKEVVRITIEEPTFERPKQHHVNSI